MPPAHALSIDFEDWYHDTGPWRPGMAEHIEPNTEQLLELLATTGARATFFVVGDLATRHPRLVRAIAAAGHEIGSHSHAHRPVTHLTRREFRDDTQRSLRILEDVTGQPVTGYRAPYFSIKADVRWPLDILAELGVRYDTSILAIDRPPGLELVTPRAPYRLHNGMWEVPVAMLCIGRFWSLPLASGIGLRFLPPALLDRLVQRFEREIGAGVFYLHPWELDVSAPTTGELSRWFTRAGRGRLPRRLHQLLARRRFGAILDIFRQVSQSPPAAMAS